MNEAPILVDSYEAFRNTLRARKASLGMTDAALETLSGLPDGYAGKLLGDAPQKHFGPMSFFLVIRALSLSLGVQMILIDDPIAHAENARHWVKRAKPPSDAHHISKALIERVLPAIHKQTGERLSQARKRIPLWKRKQIARKAARARWSKRRTKGALFAVGQIETKR